MINSAGMIVVRNTQSGFKVLLLRAYSYWDFPKGKIEGQESPLEAAFREVKEESAITDLHFSWGDDSYVTEPYSRPQKIATYFLAEVFNDRVILGVNPVLGRPEHDEYRWFSFQEAKEISHPRIQQALSWAENKILNYNKKIDLACK